MISRKIGKMIQIGVHQFVCKMSAKKKIDKTRECRRSMKVADFLFCALIREQNPFADLSNEGEDSSNLVTHKSIKYLE